MNAEAEDEALHADAGGPAVEGLAPGKLGWRKSSAKSFIWCGIEVPVSLQVFHSLGPFSTN